ncbi:MAG: hypothetical protein ACM359_08945 [Bacillota bacterium]
MKTQRITVNKTPDQPAGQEIDVVVPDVMMEERLLSFALTMFLRDLKRENRIDLDLPKRMDVVYQTEGRFIVRALGENASYYEPPRPLALVGLRWTNGRFDLIHAPLVLTKQAAQPQTAQPQADQPQADQAQQAAPAEQNPTDKPQ